MSAKHRHRCARARNVLVEAALERIWHHLTTIRLEPGGGLGAVVRVNPTVAAHLYPGTIVRKHFTIDVVKVEGSGLVSFGFRWLKRGARP